jgi:hypothetical protein
MLCMTACDMMYQVGQGDMPSAKAVTRPMPGGQV